MTVRYARAAESGCRPPCSHSCKARLPMRYAFENSACDIFTLDFAVLVRRNEFHSFNQIRPKAVLLGIAAFLGILLHSFQVVHNLPDRFRLERAGTRQRVRPPSARPREAASRTPRGYGNTRIRPGSPAKHRNAYGVRRTSKSEAPDAAACRAAFTSISNSPSST